VTLVVDASVVAAVLVDSGPDGAWAEEAIASDDLAAPHLLPAEVASILRRAALAGDLSADIASLAYSDLLGMDHILFAFAPLAGRVWELRDNVTTYDGWYVALAEALEAPLATLDRRLADAPGIECSVLTPPRSQ
jgi:predicted nucleic acid-binding protein